MKTDMEGLAQYPIFHWQLKQPWATADVTWEGSGWYGEDACKRGENDEFTVSFYSPSSG